MDAAEGERWKKWLWEDTREKKKRGEVGFRGLREGEKTTALATIEKPRNVGRPELVLRKKRGTHNTGDGGSKSEECVSG